MSKLLWLGLPEALILQFFALFLHSPVYLPCPSPEEGLPRPEQQKCLRLTTSCARGRGPTSGVGSDWNLPGWGGHLTPCTPGILLKTTSHEQSPSGPLCCHKTSVLWAQEWSRLSQPDRPAGREPTLWFGGAFAVQKYLPSDCPKAQEPHPWIHLVVKAVPLPQM